MKESVDFAFNMPIKTQMFAKNPMAAINYTIPEVAKREKTPLEILEDRFARGELSDIEYQNKIRLMRLAKDHLKEDKKEEPIQVKVVNKPAEDSE